MGMGSDRGIRRGAIDRVPPDVVVVISGGYNGGSSGMSSY